METPDSSRLTHKVDAWRYTGNFEEKEKSYEIRPSFYIPKAYVLEVLDEGLIISSGLKSLHVGWHNNPRRNKLKPLYKFCDKGYAVFSVDSSEESCTNKEINLHKKQYQSSWTVFQEFSGGESHTLWTYIKGIKLPVARSVYRVNGKSHTIIKHDIKFIEWGVPDET